MYSADQVRDVLRKACEGQRPDDDWLRSIEETGLIDGDPNTFGLIVNGQHFFVTVEPA